MGHTNYKIYTTHNCIVRTKLKSTVCTSTLTIRDSHWWCVFSILYLDNEVSHVAVIEGHGGGEHGVQDYSQTPDITLGTLVRLALDDFWAGVQQTAHTARWGEM